MGGIAMHTYLSVKASIAIGAKLLIHKGLGKCNSV